MADQSLHCQSDNLSQHQSKVPIPCTITDEQLYLIQRAELQLAGLYDLTSKIDDFQSIACLVQPIYDDVAWVVNHLRSNVEKAKGGAA
ncbi:hypothetical protein MYX82_14685 [Acidobacteria bacterium AH-259-D05]|nr:hypothetical protein [Acidobacteria bacterium AH-259-D05]